MTNFKAWISAIRPRTLPLSVSGIIIGSSFAYYQGFFNLLIFILAMGTTLSLQILSNLANDYGDAVKGTDDDTRVGPTRAIQSGVISEQQMFEAIRFTIIIVIIFSISLIYKSFGYEKLLYALLFLLLAAACVYAAITYTVGKKAYGYRGLGDLFVFLFFGLLSTIGSYFLYTYSIDHHIILPAIALGLLSVGVLNLNNMRDLQPDMVAGKITFAVKLGSSLSKKYHLFLIGTAILIILLFVILYYSSAFNLLVLLAIIPLFIHCVIIHRAKEPSDYDGQLKVLALSTFFYSILLGIGYIL